MRVLLVLVALGLFGPSALAWAAQRTIHQKGRLFSTDLTTIKKGESLTFLNDDTVPHNVISTSPGNQFDLGSQRPGTSTDIAFTQAGEVQVFCAIHPRMKIIIAVTE
jgi:plastocyanin